MGCKCGSQIILCNLPVRFDTYRGCSHGCRYCFAQKKNDISHIERDESVDGLRSFIEGKRGNETEWCDWNIPIHWGGMSDPFQPVEKQIRASYECLKLLAETKYPFVVSTKGRLIADPEYLDLLAQCNCVLQISMVCSKYDRLERGTPSYEERLSILKTVSARVQRTIVRIQPYMPEVFHDVMKNIPRIAEAGAYGVIVEGMKFFKAKPGMTKIGGDFCYPLPRLRHDFEAIKAECHRYGLKFYSVKKDYKSLLTYCSIHSPQAPITAAVARANGMPCRIVYGGTTRESVAALPMPRLAMKYGASIVLAARSGRHSILHARAKELAAQENSFIVQYGINIIGYGDTLLTAVAAQTENLPDDIENLVMTCGSGITATGVMIGLHRYGKRVKRMHLVATAPDRRGFIHETLKKYGADREFEYHDLFHSPGFVYEKSAVATWGGIRLHPHYEAKTMQWFRSSGIAPESTLFWITGAEPRSPGQS